MKTLAARFPDAPVFQTTYGRALKDAGRPAEAVAVYRQAVTRIRDASLFHDLAVAARAAGNPPEALKAEQAALALEGPESRGAERPRSPAHRSGTRERRGRIVRAGGGSRSVERVLLDEPRKRAEGARRSRAGGGRVPPRARRRPRLRGRRQRPRHDPGAGGQACRRGPVVRARDRARRRTSTRRASISGSRYRKAASASAPRPSIVRSSPRPRHVSAASGRLRRSCSVSSLAERSSCSHAAVTALGRFPQVFRLSRCPFLYSLKLSR